MRRFAAEGRICEGVEIPEWFFVIQVANFERGKGNDNGEGVKEMKTYLLDCKDLSFPVL